MASLASSKVGRDLKTEDSKQTLAKWAKEPAAGKYTEKHAAVRERL
jgi:hypothetical protein